MLKDMTIQEWRTEIQHGLDYRRKYGLEDWWGRLEGKYLHVDKKMANSGPNIFVSTLDSLMSALNVPSPYITIKARNQQSLGKARALETVDNMLVDLLDFQYEVEFAITNCFLTGRGILKLGYDSEFGWDDTLDLGISQPLGLSATQFDKQLKNRLEYNKVVPGMPWAKSVRSQDFVVPWGVRDIDDSPWCVHRVVRHIDAVQSDLKYSNTRDLKPNMTMEDWTASYLKTMHLHQLGSVETYSRAFKREGEGLEFVELWEIHDRRTGRIKVMATGHDKWLRDDPDRLQVGGLPFVGISFVPRTGHFWVTPDAYFLLYHQEDLSDIAVQTTKHRRLQNTKFGYDEGALDPENRNKLFDGNIGVGIPFKTGFDIQKSIVPINTPTPNVMLYQDAEVVRRNAREMVGFSQNQIGEFESTGRRTATEANIVNQGAGLRLDRRQNQIRRLYTESFSKINAIIFQNWTAPRMVETVGEDGTAIWFPVTGQDLQGEYNYKIGFSVGGNESLQERRQVALQMYFQMIQTGMFDPAKLTKYLAFAWNDPEFTATIAPGVMNGSGSQAQGQAFQGASQMGPGGQGMLAAGGGGAGGLSQAP